MAGNANSGNRTASNPYKAKSAECVDPDENVRRIRHLQALKALPPIDLGDPEAIEARLDEYLEICMQNGSRPLITSYAVALGIDRSTLYRLVNGGTSGRGLGVTDSSLESLKKGLELIEANYEDCLVTAKAGQVGMIFAMKNIGWRDTVEVGHPEEPRLKIGSGTADEVAARYAALVGQKYEALPGVAEPPADTYEVPVA